MAELPKAKAVRHCGFCKAPGHTVATCTAAGSDKFRQEKASKKADKAALTAPVSPSKFRYNPLVISFDLETTGLVPDVDGIIQIGAMSTYLPEHGNSIPEDFQSRFCNVYILPKVTIQAAAARVFFKFTW
jgi:hypothetical protein